MTDKSKEELFRLYLKGKIDFAKKDQKKALDDLFAADFGSDAYFRAAERYERECSKVTIFNLTLVQFENIFGGEA